MSLTFRDIVTGWLISLGGFGSSRNSQLTQAARLGTMQWEEPVPVILDWTATPFHGIN
jgi:hypothetical protein